MTRPDTSKPGPPYQPREHLLPDSSGEIRCPRDRALLAWVEHGLGTLRWLHIAPGLMRLGRQGDYPARYGLPQRARPGKSPLHRSPPGGYSDLANSAGITLRKGLNFRIQVYCPICGKAWEIFTKEFPPDTLEDLEIR